MAAPNQEVRKRPMIIASWLECYLAARRSELKSIGEFIELCQSIADAQGRSFAIRLDEDVVPGLGDIDRHKNGSSLSSSESFQGRCLQGDVSDTPPFLLGVATPF
jgi:hypothetical protein